jgi:hypothetical protein
MARVLGMVNVIIGFFLLVLVLSGVFSQLLSHISGWNHFDSMGAKVIVCIAGILALVSSGYLVLGQGRRESR